MKPITRNFQETLKTIKRVDVIISYADRENTNYIITQNSELLLTEAQDYLVTESAEAVIDNNGIQNSNIYWNTNLLKSVCKMLDLETSNPIPKDTELFIKIGILVDNEYEYVDYGSFFTVIDSEKKLDTGTYLTTAYDKMIKFNVNANSDPIEFEEDTNYSLKQYLEMICNKCGVPYSLGNLTYNTNANISLISSNLYQNNKDVTYRDIIDDIAECLGTNFIINTEGKFTNKDFATSFTQADLDRVQSIILGSIVPTEEDYRKYDVNRDGQINIRDSVIIQRIVNNLDSPYVSVLSIDDDNLRDTNVSVGEKKESIDGIQVFDGSTMLNYAGNDNSVFILKNNNIMNANSSQLLDYVLSKIEGISYYTYTLNTFGILALEPFDFFDLNNTSTNTKYMLCSFHNDIQVSQGLSETIEYDFKENDDIEQYSTSSNEDKMRDAYIEISKATSQIVLKAKEDGSIVQVELNADAEDGSDFNVQADNINFEGKDFNITTENMKISLGTGDNRVELINASGLMTAFIVQGNVISESFCGGTMMLPMGYSQGLNGYAKDRMEFEFTIPAGFVVDKAYVTLNHMPATITYGYDDSTISGYCRNMRLYKATSYSNGRLLINLETFEPMGESGVSYQSIPNIFNNRDFSGNNSGYSASSSSDISNYISRSDTADTFNKFKVETTDGSPSSIENMLSKNGCLQGTMTVIGHMKF